MTAWGKRRALVRGRLLQSRQVLDAYLVKQLETKKLWLQTDVRNLTHQIEALRAQVKSKVKLRVKERLFYAIDKWDAEGMDRPLDRWEREELKKIMREIRREQEGLRT